MFARLSLAFGLVVALALGVVYERSLTHTGTTVTFLSVGQGDCTLLMSGGWTVLVDTGPKTPNYDGGERLVVPALRKFGVRKIDCVIITHPDADHAGGLVAVSRRYKIGKVIVSSAFIDDEKMLTWFSDADINDDQIIWIDGNASTQFGELEISFVTPRGGFDTEDNDLSLFVRVDAGEGSLAITGDASSDVEDALSPMYSWDVDILKAGHHGSNNSTGLPWLNETSPEFVIASCGRRNPYNHPSEKVVARVENYGAQFLRTDRDGSVTFVLTGEGFERVTR